MQALLADRRVFWVKNDQCAAGMTTVDDDGEEQPAQIPDQPEVSTFYRLTLIGPGFLVIQSILLGAMFVPCRIIYDWHSFTSTLLEAMKVLRLTQFGLRDLAMECPIIR